MKKRRNHAAKIMLVLTVGFICASRIYPEDLLRGPWGTSPSSSASREISIFNNSLGAQFGVAVLLMYQKMISPQLNTNCQFYPSCSEYAKLSVIKYGFFAGYTLGLERFIRCNQWAKTYPYPLIKTINGSRMLDMPEDNLLDRKGD